jgi:hypothetical protein
VTAPPVRTAAVSETATSFLIMRDMCFSCWLRLSNDRFEMQRIYCFGGAIQCKNAVTSVTNEIMGHPGNIDTVGAVLPAISGKGGKNRMIQSESQPP